MTRVPWSPAPLKWTDYISCFTTYLHDSLAFFFFLKKALDKKSTKQKNIYPQRDAIYTLIILIIIVPNKQKKKNMVKTITINNKQE